MSRQFFTSIVLCTLLCAPEALPQVFLFRHYSVANGLVSNSVNSLIQDSRGQIWIATGDGLSRYDGATFKNYTQAEGLRFPYINTVAESRHLPGVFYVATNGAGLYVLQNEKFQRRPMGQGDLSERVNVVYEDTDSSLWCGTDGGLIIYKNGQARLVFSESEVGGIFDIREVSDSTVWFLGTVESRLLSRARGTFARLPSPVQWPEVVIRLLRDSDGDFWVGSDKGSLIRYRDFRVIERLRLGEGIAIPGIDDGKGSIWVGTDEGLVRVSKDTAAPGRIRQYTEKNGLRKGPIRALLKDREDVFWLGTASAGLSKLEDRSIAFYPLTEPRWPRVAVGDGRDRIWTVGRDRIIELYRYSFDQVQTVYHPIPRLAQGDEGAAITLAPDGSLVTVTVKGVVQHLRIAASSGRPSSLAEVYSTRIPDLDPSRVPLVLLADRAGRVWCSVTAHGVVRIEPFGPGSQTRLLRRDDGMPDNGVRAMYEDRAGRLWFGGYRLGAASIAGAEGSGSGKLPFVQVEGLPEGSVRSILQSRRGTVLLGTRYNGLVVSDSSGIRTIGVTEGLPGSAVLSLVEDTSGVILIGTSQGLAKLHPEGTVETVEEFRGRQIYNVGLFSSGDLWLQTDLGFAVVAEGVFGKSSVPPPVYITSVEINGTVSPFWDGMELPPDQNSVSFEYIGISHRGEQPVRYQYKLAGADQDWHELTRERGVTYAALKAGEYEFQVRAVNRDGIMSPEPARWRFSVLAPLWFRWWFITAVVLCVAGAIWLFGQMRIRRLLEIERIRSRIATDLHDDIGASLTRITVYADAVHRSLQESHPFPESAKMGELLGEVSATSRELVDAMSDVVWSVDPRNDSFESLLLRMKTSAGRLLEAKGIEYDVDIPGSLGSLRLPLDFRRNFLLVFKEALNNIVRHSGATNVRIAIGEESGWLLLTVADNGHGFELQKGVRGNGLRNMRRRAEQLGGTVDIRSERGGGTRVALKAKLP